MNALIILLTIFMSQLAPAAIQTIKYKFGNFGEIQVYHNEGKIEHLVLFASGDGGWNEGVVDMAKALVDSNTAVAGFSTPKFLSSIGAAAAKCLYPASDLELLSKFIQKKLHFANYSVPHLVGYSSGATLVYGALAQAPVNTFTGAISLGFCADLPVKKLFCKGYGLNSKFRKDGKGVDLKPTDRGLENWYVLHGNQDKVCTIKEVTNFIAKTNGANLVELQKVGHGFSVEKNWMPQLKKSFTHMASATTKTSSAQFLISDLPLIVLKPEKIKSDYFVIFFSGDGGWAGFDKELSAEFSKVGIPVVGVNSLDYFWSPKSAAQGATDLERIILTFKGVFGLKEVRIIGYSFGADVVPFFASRLPLELQSSIVTISLLAPGKKANFEFNFTDWIVDPANGLPLDAELKKLKGKILVKCIYGDEEVESLCANIEANLVQAKKLLGGHHFDGDSSSLFKAITEK